MNVSTRMLALGAILIGAFAFAPPVTPPGNELVILEQRVKDLEKRVVSLEQLANRCLDRTDGDVNPGATPLEQMPNGNFLPAGWTVERGGSFQLLAKVKAPNGEEILTAKVYSPTDGWCRVLFLRPIDAVFSQE